MTQKKEMGNMRPVGTEMLSSVQWDGPQNLKKSQSHWNNGTMGMKKMSSGNPIVDDIKKIDD
jgi:hypothetical protein